VRDGIRRIKAKEVKSGGNKYCQFCRDDGQKIIATYRKKGSGGIGHTFACDKHEPLLKVESDHMSMADEMTWGRL
jgi:hypothetical protein